MTFRRDITALTLLGRVLDAVTAFAGPEGGTTAGADLRRAIGALRANAPALMRPCTLFEPLAACFDLARQTGPGIDGLERLRGAIVALAAGDARAGIVRARSIAFSLVQMARVAAETTFASRDDVDRAMGFLTASFDASEIAAADASDVKAYRALVALRATVVRDLTARARPLPKIVPFDLPRGLPALVLAQRLYGTAARADELIQENKVRQPLFCPRAGRALSA